VVPAEGDVEGQERALPGEPAVLLGDQHAVRVAQERVVAVVAGPAVGLAEAEGPPVGMAEQLGVLHGIEGAYAQHGGRDYSGGASPASATGSTDSAAPPGQARRAACSARRGAAAATSA